MKKTFRFVILGIVLLSSCVEEFRDELNEIHKEIDELRVIIDKTNSNLAALQTIVQALQNNDYVTGVSPIIENGIEIGYNILFSKSGVATIYHGEDGADGADGYTPQIGISLDTDNIYYWTIDGEWMYDESGQKIRAIGMDGRPGDNGKDGIVPELTIQDGYWYVTYDQGKSWIKLGKATGEDGDSMFQEIKIHEGEITFIMADGTEFVVPRNSRVKILLDVPEKETGVLPGSEIQINYTLINATDSTFVTASSNGNYSVRVEAFSKEHGRIIVRSPYIYVDGYINVMVSDGASYSFIKVINFYEHKMLFPEGLEYYVSPQGGDLHIPFYTNFMYRFEVEESSKTWLEIDYSETKSEMRDGILRVAAKMNEYEYARMGRIFVIPTNSTGDFYTEIIINQSSAYFSIDQSKYAVPVEGASITTNVHSSRGLSLSVPDSVKTWLSTEVEETGDNWFRINTVISENETSSKRSATIDLLSTDGNIYLGSIVFVQSSPVEEEISNMIFIVRANYSNDFIAHLPIAGKYDCYIDWGDGQAEHVQGGEEWMENENAGIKHHYNVSEPTSFTVRISGTVTSLDSNGIGAPCISEVVQWGKTGLQHISSAFKENYLLNKVASDEFGALSSITNLDEVFFRCSSLKHVPEDIFKNCKYASSASYTFSECSNLMEIPENIFAECRYLNYFYQTFSRCTSLKEIPENLFANNTSAQHFYDIFQECVQLESIPEDLFAQNSEAEYISGIFYRCEGIKEIPEGLFRNNIKVRSFHYLFCHCNGITEIPEKLFANNINVTSFSYTFAECDGLTEIPSGLFDNNRKVTDFSYTFSWSWNIRGESPFTVIDGVKYHLYERYLNPDHFVNPIQHNGCFSDGWQYDDSENIIKHKWIYY